MAVEPPAPAEIVEEIGAPDQPGIPGASNAIAAERAEIELGAEQENGAPLKRRSHGGALPR
jgi:hypothetical protein